MAGGESTVRSIDRNLDRNSVREVVHNIAALILVGALVACSKPPQPETTETPQPTGLESIPAPDPSQYPNFSDMTGWKNPYLVVREDGIGFVDLSNREIHILKQEEIPAELVALPSSAWPYGRVVLVAQAAPKNPSEQTKADLRKNRALLLGTLKEFGCASSRGALSGEDAAAIPACAAPKGASNRTTFGIAKAMP